MGIASFAKDSSPPKPKKLFVAPYFPVRSLFPLPHINVAGETFFLASKYCRARPNDRLEG